MERASERITIKSAAEIDCMRRAGALLAEVLELVVPRVKPGVTTAELDAFALEEIRRRGAKPAFLGLYGFPGTLCLSVNEEVVHGIPGSRRLVEGDILSIDCGLVLDGFHADMARTVPVGVVPGEAERLIEVTGRALEVGVDRLRPGLRLGDLSAAIQHYVEGEGFSVVREYTGHGIGRKLHEEPRIPNYGRAGRGVRWEAGMVVCVEPMVNEGTDKTMVLKDNWTVVTADRRRSAHMENTVAVTAEGPLVLTRP